MKMTATRFNRKVGKQAKQQSNLRLSDIELVQGLDEYNGDDAFAYIQGYYDNWDREDVNDG